MKPDWWMMGVVLMIGYYVGRESRDGEITRLWILIEYLRRTIAHLNKRLDSFPPELQPKDEPSVHSHRVVNSGDR